MSHEVRSSYGQDTLRYVRLMLLVVPLLMIVAIIVYAAVNHRIEDSISSYYLGPARDLFVAMMVTTGALLVVYSGPPLEDISLNLAGFYAMFIALVPTQLGNTLSQLDLAAQQKLILSVRVGIIAIIVVSLVFVILGMKTNRWPKGDFLFSSWTKYLSIGCMVLLAAFLGLVIWRVIEGNDFAWVHTSAAALLITSMGVAIASHLGHRTLCAEDTSGGKRIHYAALLYLMGAGLVAWPILKWSGVAQTVFIIEWYQISLFAYFWYLESKRLWGAAAQPEGC
ncbi:hypothetical protein [Glutamicibacter sp.]|uniref:hypothetical protein n=1 Tax=Glutamicibacter sp. TaxID=1931995 RepID=UPI0028BD48EA|nr:hypothetical protein [Glutamicibacter sp.]